MTGSNGWRGEPRPAFPFYAADWLSSERVQSLTLAQQGAYITLLAVQWREGSVSDRIRIRLGSQGMTSGDIDAVLEAFPASPDDGLRRNRRLERERSVLVERREKAIIASRKGNSIRWGSQPDPNGIAKRRSSSSSSSSSVSSLKTEKIAARTSRPRPLRAQGDPEAELQGAESWLSEVVRAWIAYRAEKRQKPYTPSGLKAFVGKTREMGQVRARAALQHSMAGEFQGLYEPPLRNGKVAAPTQRPNAAAYRQWKSEERNPMEAL